MVDIVPETINRIRLSDNDLRLLHRVLKKMGTGDLTPGEKKFHEALLKRVKGRLDLKKND